MPNRTRTPSASPTLTPASILDPAILGPRLWPERELRGHVGIHAVRRGETTVATRQSHRGSLRLIRPHYLDSGGHLTFTLLNPGGGYFSGDDYRIDVRVGPDASLTLTDQGATSIYKTPGDYCMQEFNIVLDSGAYFEYIPSQLIAFSHATYHQFTRVTMAPDATLVLRDIITPGWSPTHAHFTYDEVRIRTAIYRHNTLLMLDNLLVRPEDGTLGVDSFLYLEDMTHVGTMSVIDARIDSVYVENVRTIIDHTARDLPGHVRAAATLTSGPGFAVRVLGSHTDEIATVLDNVTNHVRAHLRQLGPLSLRKH